jgi:hypothetical protein
MPHYRYLGDDARHFPTLGIEVEPGDEFDDDRDLDPAWFKATRAPKKPTTDTPAVSEPQE